MWKILLAIYQWCNLLSSTKNPPTNVFFFFDLWVENKLTLKYVHGIHAYMYSKLTNTAALGREKRKMTNILLDCLVTWSNRGNMQNEPVQIFGETRMILIPFNMFCWELCPYRLISVGCFGCSYWISPIMGNCPSHWHDTLVDLSDTVRLCYPNGPLCLFTPQQWTDYQLQWNVTDYPGVSNLRFRDGQIWKPDILLYNRWVGWGRWVLSRIQVRHRYWSPWKHSMLPGFW